MGEMIWKIGFDEKSAQTAGKMAGKSQARESDRGSKDTGGGGGAFKGGLIGGLLGNLLASVKQLFDPLSAIATLLVAALFPILKPFLILFLKIGFLLFRWLQNSLSGLGDTGPGVSIDAETGQAKVNDSLKSALFIIGGIIGAIVAALAGAPALLIAGIAILGGLLVSKVGGFLIDMLLKVVSFIDGVFGSNLLEPLKTIFDGISNVFNGLWNTVKSLLSLDFAGVMDGLKQILTGLWQIIKGNFLLAWEALKTIFTKSWEGLKIILIGLWEALKKVFTTSWEVLKDIGSWIFNSLKDVFSSSFNALKGIGSWIWDKVTSFFSFGGGGGSSRVNDAMITPTGDLIRTNPSDYLIATKNPGSMGTGGGSKQVTVNINGGMITEDVARDIGRILQREINYGGGF